MSDGEHNNDSLRRWLADDLFVLNTVFLVAASSLAIALTSCLWHHIHPEPPTVDQQHPDNAPSIFSAALSSLHSSVARIAPSTTQGQSFSVPPSGPAAEQKDPKSTRSKERRRRGKDPFRDMLKGGKKSKALLKAVKDTDRPPPSADTLSNSSAPGNDTSSSTSRSQSPEPVRDILDLDHRAPHLDADSADGSVGNIASNGDKSPTSAIASSSDISDNSSSDACSRADAVRLHSVTPDSMSAADTQVNVSSASTVIGHASEEAPSSPPISAACTDIRTPQPRNSQAAFTSESCAKLVRARTRLRMSRIDPSIKSPRLSSPLPDTVAGSFPFIHSNVTCPSLSVISSTHSTDGAGPSTPTHSRGSTPPRSSSPSEDSGHGERNAQPLDRSAASAQIQLASMHGALEGARLREEQLRVEAEQASKERDELRWRWNEDAGLWRRREAELQAQIHYLIQQVQAYVAVASFQAQQASNPGFPCSTSPHTHSSPLLHPSPLISFPLPPAVQTQNSASAPAHVQALLASAPMLTPHPPGFVAPASGGLYPGTDPGMSPLLWSGLGLCVPKRDARHGGRRTPDSSASGSSSRGRQRRRRGENVKSASDESSLGDWDGMEDGSGDEDPWEEEEEDIFRNNALADAILKRPESIRGLSGNVGKRSGMGQVLGSGRPPVHGMSGAGERKDALNDPELEKHSFISPVVDASAVRTAADAFDRQ
ncbi:hypothetical protein J3R83DRAFT_2980 [Lanmaoa asiatica]|nr:hypothetical protein J3R83DRAFT_2980 [Lanmaoa asiatica]